VFRALIAADPEGRFHRNHAQVGYALREQAQPDRAAAAAALDKAIESRDRLGESGFRIYELNRALTRIQDDPAAGKEPSEAATRDAVLADLRKAAESKFLRDKMAADAEIGSWLKRNGLTVADLAPGTGP
jgi:hypothetical protein